MTDVLSDSVITMDFVTEARAEIEVVCVLLNSKGTDNVCETVVVASAPDSEMCAEAECVFVSFEAVAEGATSAVSDTLSDFVVENARVFFVGVANESETVSVVVTTCV